MMDYVNKVGQYIYMIRGRVPKLDSHLLQSCKIGQSVRESACVHCEYHELNLEVYLVKINLTSWRRALVWLVQSRACETD